MYMCRGFTCLNLNKNLKKRNQKTKRNEVNYDLIFLGVNGDSMSNILKRFIKKHINKRKSIILTSNDYGTVTVSYDILHSLLFFVLKDYKALQDSDIEFIRLKDNQFKLFIISSHNLDSISDNKISVIKKKIISSFKNYDFLIKNVLIISEEKLKE